MSSEYPELHLYIGGQWQGREGRSARPVVNPATGQVLGALPVATDADADRALSDAAAGFALWRAVSPLDRSKVLRKAADLIRERAETIARLATLEEGKILPEARIETLYAADTFDWYAEEGRRAYGRVLPRAAGKRSLVVKEPIGPVAAFCPWNFPVVNPARKLGAALAAGCSVILKPDEEAPATALAIARCVVDAGLPAGVMSVLFGDPAHLSERLLASPVIRKLSFTGSVPVGKHLVRLCADTMKRTTMELGGHAPVLVFDDVDLDQVLDLTVGGKFRNAGQVCVAPTRFYVQEGVYDRFVAGFTERAKAIQVGDGLAAGNRMGPLAHDRRPEWVESLIAEARSSGARLTTGGDRIGNQGYFYQPTVLADVPEAARIMNEEPFGPVAVMSPFATVDEAIARSNRLPFGLAAYAFTQSVRTAGLLGDGIEAGMIGINTLNISQPDAPFGGLKESGHGSENAIEGLDACLVTKQISQE